MAAERKLPVMFEFDAAIQIYGAETIQEAERLAQQFVEDKAPGISRVARVNTDTYPEIMLLDEDDKEVEPVPDYEIERYDETENKWREE